MLDRLAVSLAQSSRQGQLTVDFVRAELQRQVALHAVNGTALQRGHSRSSHYRRQPQMWTPRDRVVMTMLESCDPGFVPNNHPDISGSVQEGASIRLPILIETMFTHSQYGNVRAVAVLLFMDKSAPDGMASRLGNFEHMRSYLSRQPSRALCLHQLLFVEPRTCPLVTLCYNNRSIFSSFNASVQTLGNHHQGGWFAWHVLHYPELSMAHVMQEIGFANHPSLLNERVHICAKHRASAEGAVPESWSLRDALATQCRSFECDEYSCAIPDSEFCKMMMKSNNVELRELLAEGKYRCRHGVQHSMTPTRRDGDCDLEAVCDAQKMVYAPPVLKPRALPEQLTLASPAVKRTMDYKRACFRARHVYPASSTMDYVNEPSARRLAIQFEEARGMGQPAVYMCCVEYFSGSDSIFDQVLQATPGYWFVSLSDVLSTVSELYTILQTWREIRSTPMRLARDVGSMDTWSVGLALKQDSNSVQLVKLPLRVAEEACRLYLAATPDSPFGVRHMRDKRALSRVLTFVGQLPTMPVAVPPGPPEALAASSALTIEEVRDGPEDKAMRGSSGASSSAQ